jgi:hypothetical protein
VLPKDFIDFLNFIDKYPTTVLSINLLEHQLLRYMKHNNILPDHEIHGLIAKYQLKHLYLSVHKKHA